MAKSSTERQRDYRRRLKLRGRKSYNVYLCKNSQAYIEKKLAEGEDNISGILDIALCLMEALENNASAKEIIKKAKKGKKEKLEKLIRYIRI